MTAHLSFIVDDDVSLLALRELLNSAGLTISSIDGFRFRVHRRPGNRKVVNLDVRRRRTVAELDAAMRAGFRGLAIANAVRDLQDDQNDDGPGAA